MEFICIERENIQPTFMEVVIDKQTITRKILVSVPLKIIFTTQTGELTHECILVVNKKPIDIKERIRLLENKKRGRE